MKIAIIFSVIATIAMINASPMTSDDIDLQWLLFIFGNNKTYKTDEEYLYRRSVFTENYKLIAEHNELYTNGQEPYRLGVNNFSDLTHAEFVEKMNSFVRVVNDGELIAVTHTSIPDAIDYRTQGYVTPVKDQGSCSSAWAFSAAGAIEGQIYRLTKKLIPLSVQNLIDCSSIYKNHGCEGGTTLNAFRYVSNMGLNSEIDYPYAAKGGECRFERNKSVASSNVHMEIHRNETLLKIAVGILGPVSATIDITQEDFRSYKSGVYYNANCSSTDVNHAVLVVGYGTDELGRDYWIVKNSWGPKWGDNGYVLMARNRNNNCGIATLATVPLL